MSESSTIAPTGFEHLLGLASKAAGGDPADSIDVNALRAQFTNGGSFVDWLLDQLQGFLNEKLLVGFSVDEESVWRIVP